MPVRHHNPLDVSPANNPERLATSTRVLLDSPSQPVCVACSRAIEQGTRYKCVTVRDQSGQVDEHLFCDDACLHDKFDDADPRM